MRNSKLAIIRRHFLIVFCLALFSAPWAAHAQPENPLVGVWSLSFVKAIAPGGSVEKDPYGSNPHGYISYTADGYMSVILTFADRPHISGTWRTAPDVDKAAAFETVLAYAGRYSLSDGIVTHHVDVSTDPNRVGTSISRDVRIDGESVTLTTPAINLGAGGKRYSLTWTRAAPQAGFALRKRDGGDGGE